MSMRILIVEDEALIAMMAEDMLESIGHRVAAIAATLQDAHAAIADGGFDAAMLDVNLNGDNSMPLAARLKADGCPFLFTTGYGSDGVAPEHGDVPVLAKPYALTDLEAALKALA